MKRPSWLRFRLPALTALLLLVLAGCGAREIGLGLMSPDQLYTVGLEAYQGREWERAVRVLDIFVRDALGDPRVPDARMMLGDAHMQQREYATAATHYQRLVTDYPAHPRALEARSLTCESYYRLSPRPALDQEYTQSALLHCESVAQNYPGTTEAEQAAGYVSQLREKLAQKVYDTGMFYFRRRAFDSAAVYFREVVDTYPNTPVAPAALSQLVETYNRIGYVEDAEEARERLLREYPQSDEAQAAQALR